MIESYVRPLYQRLAIEPFVPYFMDRFSENQIRYCSIGVGIGVALALLIGFPILSSIFLLISGYLITMDRSIARLSGKSIQVNSVLDIVSDRIVEFAIILGLMAVDPTHRAWLAFLMLGSSYICVTSFLIVAVFIQTDSSKELRYTPGIMERAEAFLFFLFMIWMPNHFSLLAILFTVLMLLTSYIRVKQFMNEFR